ncbi:hypothetical protein I8752_04310 [Nostocaceae cyanobacterium CENA369]|uniref:Uncharacterized protein n=1 Tax=Dendronalium phyllosphericum CENA369 TaxID=1725256 RepID=A0A8J7I3I3_9NOST|nr:hypothetical protein [Dendronalium phyllosphericum]MBH8572271.1 hypothetical protein [Dendronalium phyllosphericum CENA369]
METIASKHCTTGDRTARCFTELANKPRLFTQLLVQQLHSLDIKKRFPELILRSPPTYRGFPVGKAAHCREGVSPRKLIVYIKNFLFPLFLLFLLLANR